MRKYNLRGGKKVGRTRSGGSSFARKILYSEEEKGGEPRDMKRIFIKKKEISARKEVRTRGKIRNAEKAHQSFKKQGVVAKSRPGRKKTGLSPGRRPL